MTFDELGLSEQLLRATLHQRKVKPAVPQAPARAAAFGFRLSDSGYGHWISGWGHLGKACFYL